MPRARAAAAQPCARRWLLCRASHACGRSASRYRLAAALGSPCRHGKTKANHLSRSACLIGRLRQIKPSLSFSTQSATVLHTTSSKREASRAPLLSGPFAARPVICAYAPAHSRLVLSPLSLTAHATIRTAPFDASEPFGFFSLNRRCRRKHHGAPPKKGGRACKPVHSCKRLPAGTVLKRFRWAIRRPIWRAVRGGLRTRRFSYVRFATRTVRHPASARWRC
jgi:hypothetical protein